MRKEVSEKTLEINVCSEILAQIRNLSGHSGSFWMGMKQNQEFRSGLDVVLRNAPGYHLMLQFKSPHPRPPNAVPYRFQIGGRQFHCLHLIANSYPGAVYYVFPFYNTLQEVGQRSPHLLDNTWFLKVSDIAHSLNNFHSAECFPGRVRIHSEPFDLKLRKWKDLVKWEESGTVKNKFATSESLQKWLVDIAKEYKGRQAGQIFRGLSTIYIPTE